MKMFKIILVTWCIIISIQNYHSSILLSMDENSVLAEKYSNGISKMLKKSREMYGSLLILTIITERNLRRTNAVVDTTLEKLMKLNLFQFHILPSVRSTSVVSNRVYLMFLDEFDDIKMLIYDNCCSNRTRSRHKNQKYFIIFTGRLNSYKQYELIKKYYTEAYKVLRINLYVTTFDSYFNPIIWSFKLNTLDDCRSIKVFGINISAPNIRGLYQKDYSPIIGDSNFNGCPLQIGTVNHPPFMIFQDGPNGDIPADGIEYKIIMNLANRMNFTPIFHYDSITVGRRTFYLNQTEGRLIAVDRGVLNISIGYLILNQERLDDFTIPSSYITTDVLLIVEGVHKYPYMARLKLPLDLTCSNFLLTVFFLVLAIIILMNIVKPKYRDFLIGGNNQRPIFHMIQMMMGLSVGYIPSRNFARFLFIEWIVLTMIIRTLYLAMMAVYLQDDRVVPLFATLDDFYKSGTSIRSTSYAALMIDHINENDMNDFIKNPYSTITLNSTVSFYGVAMNVTYIELAFFNRRLNFKSYSIPQRLNQIQLVMVLHRNSFLAAGISQYLGRFSESGLISHWISQYSDKRYINPTTNYDRRMPRVLTIEHISGIYRIFLTILIASLVVFLLELLTVKFVLLKMLFDRFS